MRRKGIAKEAHEVRLPMYERRVEAAQALCQRVWNKSEPLCRWDWFEAPSRMRLTKRGGRSQLSRHRKGRI